MPKFIALAFLVMVLGFRGPVSKKTYCNERFDFCIEYPDSFKARPAPENGDGQIFLSADQKTEIRAFGRLAIEDLDQIKQEYGFGSKGLKLTYKKITKNLFIISGHNQKGEIVYRKTIKKQIEYRGTPGIEVFQTLMITYPVSEKGKYESYCRYISTSL